MSAKRQIAADGRAAEGSRRRASSPAGVSPALGMAALLLAGCGGDGMTDGDLPPASLTRTSPAADTTLVGRSLEPSLGVRVEDAEGEPVGGVDVQFAILSGTGSLEPPTATTGGQGEATSVYTAGSSSGLTTIEARIPSASSVSPVTFEIAVRPADEVDLAATGGDGQTAEPGSQLPDPLRIRATTPTGDPAGGVRVVWTIEDEPLLGGVPGSGAALSTDTAFTDTEGEASTLLTLSDAAGDHTVRAVVPGRPDTIRFSATGDPDAVGDVVIDSVRPLPLAAGGQATIHGEGFATTASENTVTVGGVEASVRSAAADRLEFDVPAFEDRCLPARTVGVRAEAGGELSNGPIVELVPAEEPLDLAVGETRTVTDGAAAGCLQLAAADDEREYRIQVQSASRSAGANTPVRLIARAGDEAGATPQVRRLAASRTASLAGAPSLVERADAWHARFRENAVREAIRVGARPARPRESAAPRGLRLSHTEAPPAEGDTLDVLYAVSGTSVSCTDTTRVIGAVVREVGERVALLEDTLARESSDPFTDAEYAQLRDEFDEAIFATDSAYFGAPTDIDHNERVLVLVTPEVNKLSDEGGTTIITGFFVPTDLADAGDPEGDGTAASGTCPTSNEGEILYLLAPDPTGTFGGSATGPEISKDRALRSARGTSAHEHQHLLNTATRLIRDGGTFQSSLMDSWLDEGLSHVAEEVVGYRIRALEPRQNLDFDQAVSDDALFEAFFFQNFLRLREYWLAPADTRALAVSDPGGTGSLRVRGFGWIFLRWLADRWVPDGSGGFLGGPEEEALFREMARGGPSQLTGTDNVLRAVEQVAGASPTWGELLAEFAPMAHVDDDVAGVDDRFVLPSWQLRDVYRGLNEALSELSRDYPLQVTDIGFGTAAYEFEVRGSGIRYFRLSDGGPHPALSLELASTAGGPVPSSAVPQVTVVRVR